MTGGTGWAFLSRMYTCTQAAQQQQAYGKDESGNLHSFKKKISIVVRQLLISAILFFLK